MNFKNEEAVSPVIGVILMVAITVILAAVIAAFVFGMTDNVQTQKNVAIGLQKAGTSLQVTIQGGADVADLTYLMVTIGTDTYYTTDSGFTISRDTATARASGNEIKVGQVFVTEDGKLSDTEKKHVVVTGKFSDGHEQMLADRTL
jgi:flagellin-like protein